MFIETLNSTSKNEHNMQFDNSIEESTDEDDDEEFPPLPSEIDLPSYTNTPDSYDNRRNNLEFFYCVSPPLPSPPTLTPTSTSTVVAAAQQHQQQVQSRKVSPVTPPISPEMITRIYANSRSISSIRNQDNIKQKTISFATQQKKKSRAPIAGFHESVYANIPVLVALPPISPSLSPTSLSLPPISPPPPPPPTSSPPLPSKSPDCLTVTNEVTYATLINTTSVGPLISSDPPVNHVHYQEIDIQNKITNTNRNRIYENIRKRRPPPPPEYSQTKFLQRTSSTSTLSSTTTLEINKASSFPKQIVENTIPSSSARIYMNLECSDDDDDKPPIIPMRTVKQVQFSMEMPPLSSSPLPPAIPPRNEHNEDTRSLSSTILAVPVEKAKTEEDHNAHETRSDASSAQTVKELEVNMAPNLADKSDLYRTKMCANPTENIPSFLNVRHRRLLHGTRRRRLRGSVAIRGSTGSRSNTRGSINNNNHYNHSNNTCSNSIGRQQNTRSTSNITVRHPMVTDDRWRRTLRKRRRQRAVQMKLDGNQLNQQIRSTRPLSDHTYNEIKQPTILNNRTNTNIHNPSAGGVLERAMQFNGALRDRVFSWYRGANHNGRQSLQPEEDQKQQQQQQQQQETVVQICSASENGESDQKGTTTNEDEEEEDDDEEEEFFTHDTFEDFLLRRRPKSSASTTISATSTIVSQIDSVSQRIPIRKVSNNKPHTTRSSTPALPPHPPPPPPPPPPLPASPPPGRRVPGLALGLDKTDVDFIHNILQRTRGEHRVWNRITALKEAYIRATSKKKDLIKKPKPNPNQMDDKKKKKEPALKHSLAATKIRAELEKYDELPTSTVTNHEEDYYYDETCSVNNHHKMNNNSQRHSVATGRIETPSTAHRILNFVVSIKRRAQNNVQQLQKNLHEIRSRVNIEAMATPPREIKINRHTSVTSKNKQILRDAAYAPQIHQSRVDATIEQNNLVRRTNSHHSATSSDHMNTIHRRQLNRTQSNVSQLPQQLNIQHHRYRLANEKSSGVIDPSPILTIRPPLFERHSSRQVQNGITLRQQRPKNPT